MTPRGPLAVLGAINVDLVVAGAALPRPGETVVGGALARHHGGKGGNQAVAAARAGAEVVMLGAVGRDPFGDEALEALGAEGVDASHVPRSEDATGVALIVVDGDGENQISVAPGANGTVGDLGEVLDRVQPSMVLASCEVSYEALISAAAWCEARPVTFVLNPAPASATLRGIVGHAAVVTPNEGELAILMPGHVDAAARAKALVDEHAGLAVVVTRGAEGAVLVSRDGTDEIASPEVGQVVDTTGAGDCFNGVLAAGLWEGRELSQAVRRGVIAAASSVGIAGAREGMPGRARIDELAASLS